MASSTTPSLELYGALQDAFDHFNRTLFAGALPPCLITLRAQRTRYGHHQHARFVSRDGASLDELALNPGYFALRPVETVLSTLAHEMVHHWQENAGAVTPSNHHNREWAEKMKEIGLMPSTTGAPGGEESGSRVSHYIIEGGPFAKACQALLDEGFVLPVYDRHAPEPPERVLARSMVSFNENAPPPPDGMNDIEPYRPEPAAALNEAPMEAAEAEGKPLPIVAPPPPRPSNRSRLACPQCGASAWISKEVILICGSCAVPLEAV